MNYKDCLYVNDRDKKILELCRDKAVLHIGACDAPYTAKKLSSGQLLHKRLVEVAGELVGVDVDEESIAYLKAEGISGIVNVDFFELKSLEIQPDIIVFGETIEHLENPGLYLETLNQFMTPEARLIISTPNCYSISAQCRVLLNKENIHPDHRVGFSAALLEQLLDKMGFKVERFYFTFLPKLKDTLEVKLFKAFSCLRHGWADTLLVVATVKNDD